MTKTMERSIRLLTLRERLRARLVQWEQENATRGKRDWATAFREGDRLRLVMAALYQERQA
jgi:hypothetical protein